MKARLTPSIRASCARFTSALGLIVLCSAATVSAANSNPGVLPPDSTPHGKTYGQWAVAWWQWALAAPEASNPVIDLTGEFSHVGQSGQVWFLGGSFGNSVERNVTVPAGKAIFMPVHQWIFGSAVFDCDPTVPGVPCDVPELRAKAASAATGAEVMEVSVDGISINNIRDYRALSPDPFSITLPEGAVFGLPAGTFYPQVADGYWLMLAPLTPGVHTISVHAVNSAAGVDATVVYHLTVK